MSTKDKDPKETIRIVLNEHVPVEKALRKFKRLCDQLGVVKEYRKREAYSKPSVRAKEKREAAEKRRKKTVVKQYKFGKKI
jgi:small subunit ribosomal protein S21